MARFPGRCPSLASGCAFGAAAKGRSRTFLLNAMEPFWSNERDKVRATSGAMDGRCAPAGRCGLNYGFRFLKGTNGSGGREYEAVELDAADHDVGSTGCRGMRRGVAFEPPSRRRYDL